MSFEAENGTLAGGAQVQALTSAPTNPYSSPQLEASGHAYVQLTNNGQSVTWTNTTGQSITAINIRSCIPDAPTGGGITSSIDLYVNGSLRQAFNVNSLQNYCYEGTNYNGQEDKNPADGGARGFWNDTRAFIAGAAVAPGDALTLQKDAANSAAFYYIDVVDLEAPPAPLPQPANSLSILSYGAISNNISVDNTTAINNCFSAAQAQGKVAWIPPGTFYISAIHGGLNATGITIDGAGPWYSMIYRVTPANNTQGVANIIDAVSCTLQNVALDCNAISRAGNNNNGAVDFSGNNWVVNNVWIQHVTSSFWCAGFNGIAENCRTLSTWADGGNFNNVQSDNGIGMNLTYSNNFVRGTGDDAMAINSVNINVFGNTSFYYTTMSKITYVNNTAIDAWGGKGIGIYGGINDLVTNNLLCDTARYIGLGVGKFGVNGSDLFSAQVLGNTVLRCGGNGYSQQQPAMMIGNGADGQSSGSVANAYCASNTIINALYDGVGFTASTNIVFQYNTIIAPGRNGIVIGPPSLGSGIIGCAIVNSNSVSGLKAGQVAFTNNGFTDYAIIVPVMAATYSSMSGVITENCIEGGQDVTGITSGDWAAFSNLNLNGANAFVARAASATSGGNLEIHLDSPGGTLIGVCGIPGTGGWQNFTDAFCAITNASGT
ncbi:MAG TPA: carbohydrate-binding protein, partial [Verrucomicrobiae bacterium]|nr:carbohydrate-binding protein [Verrucomicrobiae bacterium]